MPKLDSAGANSDRWLECIRGVVTPFECDQNDHLTVRAYLPKFEDATYFLLAYIGVPALELPKQGVSTVSLTHTLRYVAELRTGEPFVVTGAFVRIGRTSVTYALRMTNPVSGVLAATCTGVDAMFDLGTRRSIPWPEDIRTALETRLIDLTEEEASAFGA